MNLVKLRDWIRYISEVRINLTLFINDFLLCVCVSMWIFTSPGKTDLYERVMYIIQTQV